MRSDEEFYAYVWEKYRRRHPRGKRQGTAACPGGYQYQAPAAVKSRRPWVSRCAAAGVTLLAATVIGGSIFGGRLLSVSGSEGSGSVSSAPSEANNSGHGKREMNLWYRRISAGYLPDGSCRATAVTDSEALQAHLRRVDSQGAEKGWPAADWTVEEDLSGLSSFLPVNGRVSEVFDEAFFQRQDLLVVEYTSSWQFPMEGTYVVSWEGGAGTLTLDAHTTQIECATTYWQLFLPFDKGEAPQVETFTVEVNPPWDVTVRRVRTHFLEDEAIEKQPQRLSSREELESLLTKWQGEITGYWDTEDPENWKKRYGDAFFEEHDLIILPLTEPSGSIRHRVTASPTRLAIERQVPCAGTCDMAYYFFFMEAPKHSLTPDSTVEVEITTVYEPAPAWPTQAEE